MRKAIILFTVIITIILSGCSDGGYRYEGLVDQLHEFKPYFTTSESDFDFRESVGTWPRDDDTLSDLLLDEDFFNAYVEKYGIYDLLERYNDHIYCAEDPAESPYGSEVARELNNRNTTIKNTIFDLQAYKDLPTITFNGSSIEEYHNASGYYENMKDQKEETEVKGEFNDSSRDNEIYKETRSQTTEVKYYGDWMVEHKYGSQYDKGKYGWDNGEFIDESPTWEKISTFTISYCGIELSRIDRDTLDGLVLEYKLVDGKLFTFKKEYPYYAQRIIWIAENVQPPNNSNSEDDNKEDDSTDIDYSSFNFSKATIVEDGKYVISCGDIREKLTERFAAIDTKMKDCTDFSTNHYLDYSDGDNKKLAVYLVPREEGYSLNNTIECFAFYSNNDVDYSEYYAVAVNLFDSTIDINYAKAALSKLYDTVPVQDISNGQITFYQIDLNGIEVHCAKYDDLQVYMFLPHGMDFDAQWRIID